jgi:hypothetical protein
MPGNGALHTVHLVDAGRIDKTVLFRVLIVRELDDAEKTWYVLLHF